MTSRPVEKGVRTRCRAAGDESCCRRRDRLSGVDEQTGQEPLADQAPRRSTSRRVAINAVSNWLGQGVQVAVNMFLLAYVLPRLDEARFGVFRLAVSLSVGVRILSFGMGASASRSGPSRSSRWISAATSPGRVW